MQRLVTLLILAAMLVGGAAFAQVTSTPVDWNNAELQLTVQGDTPDQVVFSVPSATLVLDYGSLAPGQTFNVVVPITNTTDRAVYIDDAAPGSGDSYEDHPSYGSYFTVVSPGQQHIPANTTENRVYTVDIVANNGLVLADTGQTVTINFTLEAEGIVPSASTQSF